MFDFFMSEREREIAMIERTGYPSWQQEHDDDADEEDASTDCM